MKKTFLLQKNRNKIYYKKEQGITLIALVVTVIVLLILASVTISTIFSDNGIIKKAQDAANKTKEAVEQEQEELNQLYNDLASIMNNTTGGSTEEPEPEPEPELPSDGSYSEDKGVNTPNLGKGMTAIKWDDSTKDWVETTGSDPDWYDYSAKKWANAKTEDGSMWVWIPRYAYSIPSAGYHTSTATEINIEFMKGTSNEGAEGRTSFDNASGAENWNIHPAFNYGETVSGIWVAKFEASQNTDTLQVKAGVPSWRNITINNAFITSQKYNTSLNSHMMKNSEWGAVAYLSRSKYGKNSEVTINSTSFYYTGGGTGNAYATTNTAQSTTGNVYGIYDMSGGAHEYVAAYVDYNDNSLTYGKSIVNAPSYMREVYKAASTNSLIDSYYENSNIYGDAMYETSLTSSGDGDDSWYNDWSYFPTSTHVFFCRGGYYFAESSSGMFCFAIAKGTAEENKSFRPVLIII